MKVLRTVGLLCLASSLVSFGADFASAAPRHGVAGHSHGRVAAGRGRGARYATRGRRGGGDRTGAAVAGAALGLFGAAVAGAAASNAYGDEGYYGGQGYGYGYGRPAYGYYGY